VGKKQLEGKKKKKKRKVHVEEVMREDWMKGEGEKPNSGENERDS